MSSDSLGYQDTPILPDSGFHVHDGLRPQPPIVTPGEGKSPPSDAKILFDGSSLDAWVDSNGSPAKWKVGDGFFEVVPDAGDIYTKESFGSMQLHLEFTAPIEIKGESQGRGNSGVFLMSNYEIQVLDNYDNPTYPDGTAGAIYGQYPPIANAIRKPGEWNIYDIVWEAPKFDGESLTRPAYVTVLLNNVVLHHRRKLFGSTGHQILAEYQKHGDTEPLQLQAHGDLVRYRNIWIRPLPIST